MPTPDPIDAALRNVLRSGEKSPAPPCDAELAAAYVERRLQPPERERFESHMAQCSGCRALAAMLAQELPPEAPAPARGWFQLRWAVPAMAGIVLIGSVVLYQRNWILDRRTTPHVAQVAVRPAPEPPATLTAPAEEPKSPVQKAPAAERRLARRETDDLRSRARSDAPPQESVQVAAAPPPAAPAALLDSDQAVAVAGGAIQVPAAPQRANARAGGAAAYQAAKMAKLVSPLPDGAPLNAVAEHDGKTWAVSTGGRIFQSTDAGRTWTKVISPTTADLVRIRWDAQASLFVVGDLQGNEYRVKP